MTPLEQEIEKIVSKREQERLDKEKEEIARVLRAKDRILLKFEDVFREYIELLRSSGVEYSAIFKNEKRENAGYAIKFTYKGKELLMDMSSEGTYRYMFDNGDIYQKQEYGSYDKEDFLLYLRGLFVYKQVHKL
jgi:hypothetical protein